MQQHLRKASAPSPYPFQCWLTGLLPVGTYNTAVDGSGVGALIVVGDGFLVGGKAPAW